LNGDIVRKFSAGGGGVGDPVERDPELVREDVANGLVSVGLAAKTYKLAIDPKTFEIDRPATKKLRAGAKGKASKPKKKASKPKK
jgi:N-methylhydantoinase B